ncbi:MAG: TdeIII family type II restriction endonuclease [Oscillospiraceae bacterium]|nr:TdeIII family type II restriction endonuclease [Oscillospiraceae bacterium]
MTDALKSHVEDTIAKCLRFKFHDYTPKNNYMPFHVRLLGRDRLALYSFIHSLNTTFGSSVFEPVAVSLAKEKFTFADSQHIVGDELFSDCSNAIDNIMNELEISRRSPNRTEELSLLRNSLTGEKIKRKPTLADLFLIDKNGEHWIFDMKSPKPNIGEFKGFKRTLLTWSGIAMTENPKVSVHSLIAITYNPNYPEPYKSWQMRGMLEQDEVLVEKEFWDFLGGDGAYEELLDCFERVGVSMRGEIDEYFKRFRV